MTSGTTKSGPRVCVVGAGPCGLTTIKNLKISGVSDIVCYDDGDAIGGNWVFDERSDRQSVFDTTHLISSKKLSEFEDYPFPHHFPDFPSHRQMRTYFEGYAQHFELMSHICLKARVSNASLLPDKRWRITAKDSNGEREEVLDYLIVCSGHHRDPLIPDEFGVFAGQALHSSQYKVPDVLKDKRVLVIGGGNSACDIAVDIARVARTSCISMRRGYHIIPKLMFGQPSDVMYGRLRKLSGFLPRPALQWLGGAIVRLLVGRPEKYGLCHRTVRYSKHIPHLVLIFCAPCAMEACCLASGSGEFKDPGSGLRMAPWRSSMSLSGPPDFSSKFHSWTIPFSALAIRGRSPCT